MDQKLWMFEVSRRVWAGWACAAANEKELTTCAKSAGQEEKKIQEKWIQPDRLRRQPAAGERPLVTAHKSAAQGRGSTPQPVELYPIF
jgi:hypothetical protein